MALIDFLRSAYNFSYPSRFGRYFTKRMCRRSKGISSSFCTIISTLRLRAWAMPVSYSTLGFLLVRSQITNLLCTMAWNTSSTTLRECRDTIWPHRKQGTGHLFERTPPIGGGSDRMPVGDLTAILTASPFSSIARLWNRKPCRGHPPASPVRYRHGNPEPSGDAASMRRAGTSAEHR